MLPNQTTLNVAWVFPGQGSQKVGMGLDLFEAFPAARAVFQCAEGALGFPLAELCFRGPETALAQTANAQPAILTVSIACLEVVKQQGLLAAPAFMAGHSLGEYTALVAAGALTFEDGLRLVCERGRLMQAASEANPGILAAILGLEEGAVEEVCCQAGAEVCNINSPSQIVIGGRREAVLRAMDMARARGARRAVALNVSGAFHSSLMEPAQQGMRRALAAVTFRDPSTPLIANSTGQPLTTASAIPDELAQQMCRPVHWSRSVHYMLDQGVSTFVEIGPGRVLSGLLRGLDGNVKAINVDSAEAVREAVHS